jgi:hypothetical protein
MVSHRWRAHEVSPSPYPLLSRERGNSFLDQPALPSYRPPRSSGRAGSTSQGAMRNTE